MSPPKGQQPLGLGCYGLLLCLVLFPAHFLYWFGGQGYRVDEDAAILAAAARKQASIDAALREERAEVSALQRTRDELRGKLARTSERALEQLRRKIADRRESISDLDRLLLDASVGLEEIVLHEVRAALPEVEGVELSLIKGSKKFELVVDLTQLQGGAVELEPSAEPREPGLGPLVEALSKVPSNGNLRHWVGNLYLAREGAHRLPLRFLEFTRDAWRELLAGYLKPYQSSFSGAVIDNLYGELARTKPHMSQMNVTLDESLAGPHALTIVGPQRVEGQVAPGKTFTCVVQPGAYVIRTQPISGDEPGFLRMIEFEQRRNVKLEFKPRPR